MRDYLPILVMIVLVVAVRARCRSSRRSCSAPKRPNSAKQAPYECGIVPEHEPAERFPVKFYLVAMAFIVLDVEIVFLYPFTIVFRGLGAFGLVAMGVFVLVLLVPVRVPALGRRARVGSGHAGRDRSRHAPCCALSAHRTRRSRPGAAADARDAEHRGRRRDGSRVRSRTTSSPRASKTSCAGAGATRCCPATFGLACCAIEMMAHRRRALRPRALRHGGLPGQPAPGRPHDRRRPRVPEDGAGAAPGLRPDGRAQVGHLDGRVREQRRHVQQLRDRAGRRPDRPGRRVRARAARPGPRR